MYLIYLYRVIHFYITLRRLGWLGLGWDHVSFGGGCRSMYRPISLSTVDRHIGRYVGRGSTDYRPSAGRVSVESLSSLYRYVGDTRPLKSIGRLFVDSRPILCRRIMYLHRRIFPQEDSLSSNPNSRWHIYAIASV